MAEVTAADVRAADDWWLTEDAGRRVSLHRWITQGRGAGHPPVEGQMVIDAPEIPHPDHGRHRR